MKDGKQFVRNAADSAAAAVGKLAGRTVAAAGASKDFLVKAIDGNGNGRLDVEDVIILGLRVPGVKIDRARFLQKELSRRFPRTVIDNAIAHTPAKAGVPRGIIDKIAADVIQNERLHVTGISAALGAPGGYAAMATMPADIAQYYGYMLRAAQELLYLYGYPQLDTRETEGLFNTETVNILILCLGVMYGVAGANNAIKVVAKGLAEGISRKIMNTALTKGTLYPIIKSVSKWFSVNMTKKLLAEFVEKTIPGIGAALSGGLTYLAFKPCCDKLKLSLQDTMLSNPASPTARPDDTIVIE